LASLNGMAKRRQTASVGLYNELIAQAKFAKDPNKIVFVPAMGKGPIDMVVLDITQVSIKPMMLRVQIIENQSILLKIPIKEEQVR
jgi:hypothetical protein